MTIIDKYRPTKWLKVILGVWKVVIKPQISPKLPRNGPNFPKSDQNWPKCLQGPGIRDLGTRDQKFFFQNFFSKFFFSKNFFFWSPQIKNGAQKKYFGGRNSTKKIFLAMFEALKKGQKIFFRH